jgi:predicted membrane protein
MDDLLKRGLVSLGIIFGGLLMIDFLMLASGTKPIGIAAVVFHGIETLFTMLLWIAIGVAIMIALVIVISAANEKTKKIEEEKKIIEQKEKQKVANTEFDRKEREKSIEKAEKPEVQMKRQKMH